MQNSLRRAIEHRSLEIIALVGDLIAQTEREKLNRYLACGCAACQARVAKIDAWLRDDQTLLPDEDEDQSMTASSRSRLLGRRTAWLCTNCLRKVSGSTDRCYHCNTRRQRTK